MSRRNVMRADPNDWAAKRRAQIELAKQKREERAMMGDESEELTFKPKVNARPKYLQRKDSGDSLDRLTDANDIFEQPLPGSRPHVNIYEGEGMGNPPSPSSDALGNEMKRYPQQSVPQQYQQQQQQSVTSQSTYKSKFMQQYDEQTRYQGQNQMEVQQRQQGMSSNISDDTDANFFNSLRADSNSSNDGGWNNDTSNAEIPSLGPPKRKVSYRRRKPTDNPNPQYPPAPTFSSNRKPNVQLSQSHDPPPWNSDNIFDPNSVPSSHVGDRSGAKSTPTSMPDSNLDQGFIGNQTGPQKIGDIGHARSRLSLLKTKMRRSDSGEVIRPNNGEATNLPNRSSQQKSAPSRRRQQQLEAGWNSDFTDSHIPDVPQPTTNRRRPTQGRHQLQQQQQHQSGYREAENGWNSDFTDSSLCNVPQQDSSLMRDHRPPRSFSDGRSASGNSAARMQKQPMNSQQKRWNNANDMENDLTSSSVPSSASRGVRENRAKSVSQPQQRTEGEQLQQYHQPYQQPPPNFPPDAYPRSDDSFGAGADSAVGEQKQCPDCGRKFNPIPYEKHIKICAKVFLEKRKAFDSKKMRLESVAADNPDLKKVLRQTMQNERKIKQKGKQGSDDRALDATNKKAKWKAESEAFRAAMRAGKKVSHALATGGPMPEQVISAPDPSLIPCPNCGRSFNEKAAERHIPKCKDIKAKPTTLKRGSGGAGGKTGSTMKSTRGTKL